MLFQAKSFVLNNINRILHTHGYANPGPSPLRRGEGPRAYLALPTTSNQPTKTPDSDPRIGYSSAHAQRPQ